MKKLSRNAMIGYPAGIVTGITYGLNPLFGMPLMNAGASVESILFFRYGFAVLLLGAFLWLGKQSFRVSMKQVGVLLVLGDSIRSAVSSFSRLTSTLHPD
jgi:drug/metabolite transporter (DMT)-like permease